jgi:hypothetical protein
MATTSRTRWLRLLSRLIERFESTAPPRAEQDGALIGHAPQGLRGAGSPRSGAGAADRSRDIARDRPHELVELAGIVEGFSREHAPVADQLWLDRLSVDLDLDFDWTFIADRHQTLGRLGCGLMHGFLGGVLHVLVEPAICYDTNDNVRRRGAGLLI